MTRIGIENSCIFVIYRHQDLCPCISCLVKPCCNERCTTRTEIVKSSFDPEARKK